MIDGLVIEILGRDDRLDDMLHKLCLELLLGKLLSVLCGDDNSVDTDRNRTAVIHSVLDGNLGLSIRSNQWAHAIFTDFSELGTKRCGKVVCERHERLSLVSGISKHDSLITSSDIFKLGSVNRLGNIRRLKKKKLLD